MINYRSYLYIMIQNNFSDDNLRYTSISYVKQCLSKRIHNFKVTTRILELKASKDVQIGSSSPDRPMASGLSLANHENMVMVISVTGQNFEKFELKVQKFQNFPCLTHRKMVKTTFFRFFRSQSQLNYQAHSIQQPYSLHMHFINYNHQCFLIS